MTMREITFTIEEALIPVFIEAFCASYGYVGSHSSTDEAGNVTEIPNSESPVEFTKNKIKDYALEVVNAYKIEKAKDAVVVEPISEESVGI